MKVISQVPKKALVVAMTCAMLGVGASNAQAATVYFLQINGITGESTAIGHEGWISIDSFSFGDSNSGSVVSGGGGSSAGKAVFSPFSWTQPLDTSVPQIFVGVASGKHYPNATLDVEQTTTGPGSELIFEVKFDNVLLTNVDITGAGGRPTVAAELDYSKITITYWPLTPNGSRGSPVVGNWDILQADSTPTTVPLPAAVWLFGSGLLGLIGVARRKSV